MIESWEIKAYERLAKAVVAQAVVDYQEYLAELPNARGRRKLSLHKKIKECEDFFRSPLCDLYTGIDNAGETIIARADSIVIDESIF